MNISTRGRYGLRALVELSALSREGPVNLRDLSEKQKMSIDYLEQIFNKLKRAGIVQSIRGAKGGYVLATNEDEITVSQVINALDGPISISNCYNPNLREKSCTGPATCVTRVLWKGLENTIESMLSSITLKDLRQEKFDFKLKRSRKNGKKNLLRS
ncbi:MAG: RrF2 family transcriptional regulator [candidate division Zixibacteria bacterium]|jgi:Rrf2 family protein|nr:RrF2 family transcriptional regulator [candidate division Zixibacteria bacterium]